jgi:hypothetical protein
VLRVVSSGSRDGSSSTRQFQRNRRVRVKGASDDRRMMAFEWWQSAVMLFAVAR